MANTLLIKRSSVAGKSPAAADLVLGELALNVADGRLFTKKSDNSIFVINPQYGLIPTQVSLDMGAFPVPARTFSVTVNNVAAGSKVVCSLSAEQATGAGIDEYELEPLMVFGRVAAANTLEFTISCANDAGLTSGIKFVNFYVG